MGNGSRRSWFTYNGSTYVPNSWRGWVTTGIGIILIGTLVSIGIILSGGQIFH